MRHPQLHPAGTYFDPEYDALLFQDVPAKRFLAWVVDVLLVCTCVAFTVLMTAMLALFLLPLVYVSVSFLYRWMTISSGSATFGMRFMAIELRTEDGSKLTSGTAFYHTLGYTISMLTFPLQLVSIAMMGFGARGQGLTDVVLGTVAINRSTQ